LVLRDPDEIIQAKSSPQEEQRLQVPRVFLERTMWNLNDNEHVQDCTAELVFNRNEVGLSDWEIARREKLWYRRSWAAKRSMIHHGISRKVKYIAVIACVSAVGESLVPDIITSQDFPSVREQLKKHGVRFGTDLMMKSNAKPDINAEIFVDYVWTVLLPNPGELRRLNEFAEEMVVLLTDNYPSHIACAVM
jgi:hypothetical protein